jgi:DNA-binding response OmpR family regulator
MPKKILIVEPTEKVRKLLKLNLEREGYNVIESGSGEDSVNMVEDELPDLVISEVFLSGIDGFELCRRIKANPKISGIPFIFFTSASDMLMEVKGLRAGANEFLIKPNTNRQELLLKIELLLEQTSGRPPWEIGLQRGFVGKLTDVNLVEILQLLYSSGKSGVLQIANGKNDGYVYFLEGAIIDAELGKAEAENAVLEMSGWKEGFFKFEQQEIDRPKKIKTPTINLLMECRRLQE